MVVKALWRGHFGNSAHAGVDTSSSNASSDAVDDDIDEVDVGTCENVLDAAYGDIIDNPVRRSLREEATLLGDQLTHNTAPV